MNMYVNVKGGGGENLTERGIRQGYVMYQVKVVKIGEIFRITFCQTYAK